MSEGNKRDAKSLISAALGGAPAGGPALPDDSPLAQEAHGAGLSAMMAEAMAQSAAAVAEAAAQPSAADVEREAAELIEVYFELEEPAERDVVFDKLSDLRLPVVDDFFRAMMEADEDEYVRAAAAAELARRGDADAQRLLEADLEDPEEPFFFTHALQTLAEVRGKPFYETLLGLWKNPERDADERREAMLGLEAADAERALGEFVRFVEAQTDVVGMPDDQIEVAMMAFVRHQYTAARRPLEALRSRIAAAGIDPEERQELVEFVTEGIDLLSEVEGGEG